MAGVLSYFGVPVEDARVLEVEMKRLVRQAVLAVALLSALLTPGLAHHALAQEDAAAIAVPDSDARGELQVAAPAALVRPPTILLREGNVLSVIVLPAEETPQVSDARPGPPAAGDFLRPRPVTTYGGYGTGYQGSYFSGFGDGDGSCELSFVVVGGYCRTMTVTGTSNAGR